jgi:hypothetical protein
VPTPANARAANIATAAGHSSAHRERPAISRPADCTHWWSLAAATTSSFFAAIDPGLHPARPR